MTSSPLFFFKYLFIAHFLFQNITTIHFINEVMFELWSVVNNNGNPSGRPSAFISHFTTEQQAINYENEFEKILDRVKTTYNGRKATLLDELAKASEKLKKIFGMRTECTKILMDPFVQMKTFRDTIETLTEDKNAMFIREFLGDPTKFEIMKGLHVIVAFYLELHRIFDFRVTEEEVDSVPIKDVVDGTEKYHSELLQRLWDKFKGVWRLVTEFVRPKECVNAGEYEGILALIDDENSPFMRALLTLDSEDGELYRAVSDGISKFQDGILDMRDKVMSEDMDKDKLGYDNESEDLPLESLTENDVSHLITGENYNGELELIIFTHMDIDTGLRRSSVGYDYAGIARDIACKYTSGRPHLRSGKDMSFRRECNLSCDDLGLVCGREEEESEELEAERKRSALIDMFRPLHGIESLRAYMDKVNGKKLPHFENEWVHPVCRAKIESIAADTKASSEEIEFQYVRIADVLAAVLRYVIGISNKTKQMEGASKMTIGDLYKEKVSGMAVPEEVGFMSEWPGKCLLGASKIVVETLGAKEYLFRDVKKRYAHTLDKQRSRDLASYGESLIWSARDAEDVAAHKKAAAPGKVKVLESLFQALNSNRKMLVEPKTPLKRAFKDALAGIFQSDGDEEAKLLANTPSGSYVKFMAWLQKLISDLHWELSKIAGKTQEYEAGSESEKERRERERVVYKEFIPPMPTILKDAYHRFEVPYNEKLAKYIPRFGYSVGEVVILDPKTKKEVTEEERRVNYGKYKILVVEKRKK